MEPEVINVPWTRHSQEMVYHLLDEGENGVQLWKRLHPLPEEARATRHIWQFTKVSSGWPCSIVVGVIETSGPKAYRAVGLRREGDEVLLDVAPWLLPHEIEEYPSRGMSPA